MQELLRRRLPQTALTFLIAGWGLIQFVQFLEERYGLSPRWLEMLGITWVLVLPSVIFIGWLHGAPDRQPWTRRQTLFVGGNALVLAVVLALGFGSREPVGATVTTVTVEDENGVALERKIAARDYRHVIQLAFPNTDTLAEDDAWLGLALAFLLENDLFQNPFAELRSPWESESVVARAGIEDPRQLPRAMVREIAQRNRADFHTLSSLELDGADLVLRLELVRTQQGDEQARATFRNPDLFALVDEVTVWLREEMGLPRTDGDDFPDLPVAELITQSPEVMRPLVAGLGALMFDRDFEAAREHLEAAVALDPTCASAHTMLFGALAQLNRYEQAIPSIDAAMQHAYRLSERMQFLVRTQYYGAHQEVDKAFAVLEMWRKLIPGDAVVYRLLAMNHRIVGQPRRAVNALDHLLEIMPDDEPALTERADLMRELGDPAGAQRALERLVELQPNESRHHLALASALLDQGLLRGARQQAEQAQLLDPTNFDARLFVVDLEIREGRLRESESELRRALESAVNDQDRLATVEDLIALERRRSRFQSALEWVEGWDSLAVRLLPPSQLVIHRARWEEIRAQAGRSAEAWDRLADLREKSGHPVGRFVALGDVAVAIEQRDAAQARSAVNDLSAAVEEYSVGVLRPIVAVFDAEVLHLEGAHEASIARCDSALVRNADLRRSLLVRARGERALGRIDAAVATLDEYLRSDPTSPAGSLELARTLVHRGDTSDAIARLETAVAAWQDADTDHADVLEARTMLAALREEL